MVEDFDFDVEENVVPEDIPIDDGTSGLVNVEMDSPRYMWDAIGHVKIMYGSVYIGEVPGVVADIVETWDKLCARFEINKEEAKAAQAVADAPSESQLRYLNVLINQTGADVKVEGMSKQDVTAKIDELKKLKARQSRDNAPPANSPRRGRNPTSSRRAPKPAPTEAERMAEVSEYQLTNLVKLKGGSEEDYIDMTYGEAYDELGRLFRENRRR